MAAGHDGVVPVRQRLGTPDSEDRLMGSTWSASPGHGLAFLLCGPVSAVQSDPARVPRRGDRCADESGDDLVADERDARPHVAVV